MSNQHAFELILMVVGDRNSLQSIIKIWFCGNSHGNGCDIIKNLEYSNIFYGMPDAIGDSKNCNCTHVSFLDTSR